jgi:hypothetical protein
MFNQQKTENLAGAGNKEGLRFTYRTSTGGSTSVSTSANKSVPYWVRIVRNGNKFHPYYSADGVTWTQLGSTRTINMSASAYIGMEIESGVSNILDTATIDNTTTLP